MWLYFALSHSIGDKLLAAAALETNLLVTKVFAEIKQFELRGCGGGFLSLFAFPLQYGGTLFFNTRLWFQRAKEPLE